MPGTYVLTKYKFQLLLMSKIKFSNENLLFSKTLKSNIQQYFQQHHKSKTGNSRLYIKASILLVSLASIYLLLLSQVLPTFANIILCIILGVNFAAIGFNIMHDAGHDSFSPNKKLNSVLSYTLNLLGGNIYFWKLKHNIAHHTYTNIDGEDHDIEVKFMRIHHDQQLRPYHRFQAYYFPLLYGISYLAWIFYQDYEKYFRQTMGQAGNKFSFPRKEKIIFWTSKVLHATIFVLIPIAVVGAVPALIGFAIAAVVCGFSLATVFQLAHVVEDTTFKTVENNVIEEQFMIHQINSTSNFATNCKITTWLLGGLNFQVEHHLFPKISHIHYPALNKIVKETCLEFGLQYNEYRTVTRAFTSHVSLIKTLSQS